jgi:hypothetical protein
MKCMSCDTELVPGASECHACGAPVQEVSVPQVMVGTAQQASLDNTFDPPTSGAAIDPEPSFGSAVVYPQPVSAATPAEKIWGMPADAMGNIALGLGGAGCLFSVVGCGGLISVLGLVAGFLALNTNGRRNGKIGLALSSLGIIVTLLMLCIILFLFLRANPR